jgi:hypothetical protein
MITRLVEKSGYTYLGPWTFQQPWKRADLCCCCCRCCGCCCCCCCCCCCFCCCPWGISPPDDGSGGGGTDCGGSGGGGGPGGGGRGGGLTRLCALGLGAGFLGPTSSPLTLLGGSETSDPSARRSLRRLSSSEPLELPGAEALLAAPLPLSKGLGAVAGPTQGAGPTGWGPPAGTPGIRIPRRGSRPLV